MPPITPSTCLFLPELPADLTDAVLERHFRGFVGFSSSRTRHDRNGKLVGFIEFENIEDAMRCRDSMQGNSPFPGLNWHIHFSNNVRGGPPPGPKRAREDEPPPPRAIAPRTASYGAPPEYDPQRAGAMLPPAPPPGHGHSPHAAPMAPAAHPGYGQPPPPYHAPPEMHMQPPQPNFLAMQLPPDASSTLYVEGLPPDATEREVSHIFRRFEGQGYQSIRMVARESSKMPGKNLYLCFVEFDNAHQATVAMHQLQGYRLDKASTDPGVKIVYAKKRAERGPAPRLAAPVAPARAPPREERIDSYESRPSSYEPEYTRGHRRDGREHSDSYHDDYEDSERGDDDLFQRADEVTMHGLTD